MPDRVRHRFLRPSASRLAILIALVLALIVLALRARPFLEPAGGSKVHLPGGGQAAQTIELGDQLPGQLLYRQVIVPNSGRATISISQVGVSCGCLHSVLRPNIIVPGKAGVLQLQIATRPWTGPEVITATLNGTAGPTRITRRYLIRYTVRRLIRIKGPKGTSGEPYYLDLGAITLGSRAQCFHAVITRGTYPARWDSWRCFVDNPGLSAGVAKVGKSRWRLSLVPTGQATIGSQSYRLQFAFFRKGRELPYHYTQPVNFKVRGPVAIEPGSVLFGAVRCGTIKIKRLRLIASATGSVGDPQIVSVRSNDPKHAFATITNGGSGLGATFRAPRAQGQFSGRFLVTVEYRGVRYHFRLDYLAYAYGKRGTK